MVQIIKMNGEREAYNQHKLEMSLTRSGADKATIAEIVKNIGATIYDGITTQEIYEHAFELLRKNTKHPSAARYSIKRAVLDLGPSGFPFERFMGEIFRAVGYTQVRVGIAMQGKCVPHEVDLVAKYGDKRIGAEIKFHNSLGIKTDLKVALYVKARFVDLENDIDEGWLITNTRFTRNAIRYNQCANMQMLGWDYPRGKGIEKLIDKAHVHPITALTSISKNEKRRLLDNDIVLCKQIVDNPEMLQYLGTHKNTDAIMTEATSLCKIK